VAVRLRLKRRVSVPPWSTFCQLTNAKAPPEHLGTRSNREVSDESESVSENEEPVEPITQMRSPIEEAFDGK